MKSDIKAPSCAAIFLLGKVVLQCVRAGQVFCGLHVAHVRIICPVRDVTHVRKCTRPSSALPYYKRREAGQGPGNEASSHLVWLVFEGSIPTCACFHLENFFVTCSCYFFLLLFRSSKREERQAKGRCMVCRVGNMELCCSKNKESS